MEENKKVPMTAMKRKGIASICCTVVIVLWLVLWLVFPMEFYSLFFASTVGSNFTLILLAAVITIPCDLLFSKLTGADIRIAPCLAVNIIGMLAVIYTYSIFRYTAVYWVVLAFIVHTAAQIFLFIKSKTPASGKKKQVLDKKMKKAMLGVVCTAFSDGMYLLLFTALLKVFTG